RVPARAQTVPRARGVADRVPAGVLDLGRARRPAVPAAVRVRVKRWPRNGDSRDEVMRLREVVRTKRRRLVRLGVPSALALVLVGKWLNEVRPATKRGGQQPAEPFRIAGHLYYVGANDIAAFLGGPVHR